MALHDIEPTFVVVTCVTVLNGQWWHNNYCTLRWEMESNRGEQIIETGKGRGKETKPKGEIEYRVIEQRDT